MNKELVQITGFEELQRKIKILGKDSVKKREVLKILGQVANPTVKAAKALTPVRTGIGKKSIGKKNMRKTTNAVLYVSPRSTKRADGFYLRQFVIRGTKFQKSQDFMNKAYMQTKGLVTADAEVKVAKYIQKQINKLNI
jgi:HK97 gp10 family phage protein